MRRCLARVAPGDIYFTRWSRQGGWSEPVHLACAPDGPNSPLDEQGPSYVELGEARGAVLLAQLADCAWRDLRGGGLAGQDFGPAAAVGESLNDAAANDIQPNVRADRLEVVFSAYRTGTLGGQDIWVATREKADDPWGSPVNLGPAVNRRGGRVATLAVGPRPHAAVRARTRPEGMSDIYVTSRRPAPRR